MVLSSRFESLYQTVQLLQIKSEVHLKTVQLQILQEPETVHLCLGISRWTSGKRAPLHPHHLHI